MNRCLQVREAAVVESIGFGRDQPTPFQGASREVVAFQDPRELGFGDALGEAVGKHTVEQDEPQPPALPLGHDIRAHQSNAFDFLSTEEDVKEAEWKEATVDAFDDGVVIEESETDSNGFAVDLDDGSH